jgi:hypothetical protein
VRRNLAESMGNRFAVKSGSLEVVSKIGDARCGCSSRATVLHLVTAGGCREETRRARGDAIAVGERFGDGSELAGGEWDISVGWPQMLK